MTPTQSTFDIGIVTVIGTELHAVQQVFGCHDVGNRFIDQNEPFWHASLPCRFRSEDTKIVIYCLGHAGQQGASAAASKIIERFHPKLMLLCGIAAGRRGKTRIGDVAVSRALVGFSGGVATPEKNEPRIWAPLPPQAARQMYGTFKIDEQELASLIDLHIKLPLMAPRGKSREYRENVSTQPTVHDSAIASSELLLRDPEVLERLSSDVHQSIRVGEMEATGFATACEDRIPATAWFVIRGISDFGDKLKNDAFHRFASYSSAALTRQFIAASFDPRLFQTFADVRTEPKKRLFNISRNSTETCP
jgi:nucleoside phosphorylase